MGEQSDSISVITEYLKIEFGMDEDDISEIFDIFFQESQLTIKNLETNISQENFKQIISDAHGIKGSAANINALNISQIAKSIEEAAKNNDISVCNENFQPLKLAFSTLQDEYKSQN
jgi:HPt (histidine-containing phosphotransfer) domain-containing protein